jgi:hypothetical protein
VRLGVVEVLEPVVFKTSFEKSARVLPNCWNR